MTTLLEAAQEARDAYVSDWQNRLSCIEDTERLRVLITERLGEEWLDRSHVILRFPFVIAVIDDVWFSVDCSELIMIRQCACGEFLLSDAIGELHDIVRIRRGTDEWSEHTCPKQPPLRRHVFTATCRDHDEGGLGAAIRAVLDELVRWQESNPFATIERESTSVSEAFRSDDLRYSTYALTIAYREAHA